jgi:two-component system, NarL family, nitrate/nitrite response regulator NarL
VASSPERARVFILSAIRLYRASLAQALASDEAIEVVGTGPVDGGSLRSIAAAGRVVVLTEGSVVRESPILRAVAADVPDARMVAIGLSDPDHDVIHYAEAGVAGFVAADATLADLRKTIRSVSQGEFPCSPKLAALLVKRMSALAAGLRSHNEGAPYTRREAEVLALIDDGLSNKEIASSLCIEVSTVKNHVHHVLAKAGVPRRGLAAARLRNTLPQGRAGASI